MVGYGISVRNRKTDAINCLNAVCRYADLHDEVVVCDDASTDGTLSALAAWNAEPDKSEFPNVQLLFNSTQQGVAGTKFRLIEQLTKSRLDHIILIEDDITPTSFMWTDALIQTALEHKQAHLLYMPSDWKYGKTFSTSGDPGHYQIEWKQFCSGMVMYFRAALLREVGNFNKKFVKYGYEHNELSSRCLVAQGQNPERYPHCLTLEEQNLVFAPDVAKTRPKMSLMDNDYHAKEISLKCQTAQLNRPFYDALMKEHRAKFASVQSPGAVEHRQRFFE